MLAQRLADIRDRMTPETTIDEVRERIQQAIELDRAMQRYTPTVQTVSMVDDIAIEADVARRLREAYA